jgi:serine/threonine protein kinase
VQRALPGLVHRDVTPHNVLISREGEVKLTDFGIALTVGRMRSTSPSFVRGKLGYMAPEQVRAEPLDVRSDLFAVGVILFELLTRTRPFGMRRGVDELRAIATGEVTSLGALRPRVPRGLVDAVDRLLRPAVAERFATPDEALRALAPFSAGDFGSLRLAEACAAVAGPPDDDEATVSFARGCARPDTVTFGRHVLSESGSVPEVDAPTTRWRA